MEQRKGVKMKNKWDGNERRNDAAHIAYTEAMRNRMSKGIAVATFAGVAAWIVIGLCVFGIRSLLGN